MSTGKTPSTPRGSGLNRTQGSRTADDSGHGGTPARCGVPTTRGTLFVHSAPAAMSSHIEWAIDAVVDRRTQCQWKDQPVAPGMLRAELAWEAPAGSGSMLASALRGWPNIRFEVTEEASAGNDAGRWSHTPELGIFHAMTDAHGNIVVSEDRIRFAYEQGGGDPTVMYHELSLALGEAWDEELEPFRHANDVDANVRWLHRAV